MKKVMIFLIITSLLILSGIAYARHMHGMGPMTKNEPSVDIDNIKKFQKETLSLRDDLITKKLELRKEYNKPERDYNQIATLKKEIVDLKTKIEAIADKYGIKNTKRMGPRMMDGMGSSGMMKGGMMSGCPCPMCQ